MAEFYVAPDWKAVQDIQAAVNSGREASGV